MTPATIGPYEVVRPIARGGMAEVFEVRDPTSGERFALKLLIETRTSARRFNREFEALIRLNHPSIVRVYHFGFHESHPWISMELLDGTVLQSRVKWCGRPGSAARTEEVVRIGYFLAEALQYIHDRGLVHRDLKSANVQVLPDGRIKLLDFGTAHLVDPLERITMEGDFVGTFSYAAPEQIAGLLVDHRADLYALGVLLYRLTTGRRPFRASTPEQLAHMHLHTRPRSPRDLIPELPERLSDLILYLMAKNPNHRPVSADYVARELEEISGGPLSLPGSGIAVASEGSVGRDREHRALWQALEASSPADVVVITGSDPAERVGFASQVLDDGARRGWRVAVCDVRERDALRSLGASLVEAAEGIPPEAPERIHSLAALLRNATEFGGSDLASVLREAGPSILRSCGGRERTPFVLLCLEGGRAQLELMQVLSVLRRGAAAGDSRVVFLALLDEREDVDGWALGGTAPLQIDLQPLDVRATALAVGALLHRRPPPPEVARRIHVATDGRPAYVEEVVRNMVSQGLLQVRSSDGNRLEWAGQDLGELPVPSAALRDVEQRLAGLPVVYRRVLEALHLVGGEADTPLIAESLDWSERELGILADAMIEQGWLQRHPNHPARLCAEGGLVLRVLGRQTHPCRRALLQSRLAEPLSRLEPSIAQVRLLLAQGEDSAAMERAIACARMLRESTGPAEAADLLRLVAEGIESEEMLPPDVRADFHLLYSECLSVVRPTDPAAARSLALASGLRAEEGFLARVQFARASLQGTIGHYVNQRRYLLRAWELLEEAPEADLASDVALALASSFSFEGQIVKSASWLEQARQKGAEAEDPNRVANAEAGLGAIALARGQVTEAETRLAEVMHQAKAGGQADGYWNALAVWSHAVRRQGRFSEALPLLYAATPEAREGQRPATHVELLLATAWCEFDLFRLGRAQECVDEMAAMMRQGEHLHLRLEANLMRGRILVRSGQLGAASYLLQEVVDQANRAQLVLLALQARAVQAEAWWGMGRHEEARKGFQESLLGLMGTGDLGSLADVCVQRARALGSADDPTRAFRLIAPLLEQPHLRPLYLEYLLAEYRWRFARGETQIADQSLREAAMTLNRMATELGDIDRSAVRVHPWTKEIRRAMG